MDEQREVIVNGVRLAYRVSGPDEAPPVLLLHGLGLDATSWASIATELSRRFRVIALDARGHGDSDRPGHYSFELMHDDVLGLLDQLGLDRVDLVGHSMGGVVAYLVASSHPDRVARLVIEDVTPPLPQPAVVRDRPSGDVPFDWDVIPAIVAQLDSNDPAWWELLTRISAPTLLIAGGAASYIHQDKIRDVAGLIPHATVLVIDAGHHIHQSRPGEFSAAVGDFLGR